MKEHTDHGQLPQADELHVLPLPEHDRWDRFVIECGQGTIFHTAWWHRAWGMEPTVQVVLDKSGDIEAGICYCIGRRFGTSAIVRPPNTLLNGPLFRQTNKKGRNSQNTHAKQMILRVIGGLPRVGMYDFCLLPSQSDIMPFVWNGFDVQMAYTYVFPVQEKGVWMEHASTTIRRRLRKTERGNMEDGYTLDESPRFEEILELVGETAELKGYQFKDAAKRLPSWWNTVKQRNAVYVYLARDPEGRPACVDVMIVDARCAYHSLTGIRNGLRDGSQIHSYLIARMINQAHAMGLDFDFSGSILPGVERFKRTFGGELRPSYRLVKLPSPIAYLAWHGYRYWTKHRKRDWIWHD